VCCVLETSLWTLPLPISALLGVLSGAVYIFGCARSGKSEFTLIDGLILTMLMAVVTAVAMPLLSSADQNARATAMSQTLRVFRSQIELYKLEHGGQPPLLFKGGLPQLTEPTDAQGVPGPVGPKHPLGPYLPSGIPANPYTGVATVELAQSFPPTKHGTAGGWLYHQETGRIAADQEGWLDK